MNIVSCDILEILLQKKNTRGTHILLELFEVENFEYVIPSTQYAWDLQQKNMNKLVKQLNLRRNYFIKLSNK